MNIHDPLSLNLYTYCANNPLVYYDPSGHKKVLLRNKIKKAGGTIEWDQEKRIAIASIDGVTVEYKPDEDEGIYIDSEGRIVIDDQDLDKDFKDVVKHISVDRRLGMSKLDVYSMRWNSKEAIKRIPKDLSNTAGEFKDYVTSPEFKQAGINTGVIVADQTPLGGFRKAFNLIPDGPKIKADEETEKALKQTSFIKVSTWVKVHKWINIIKNSLIK